MTIATFLLSNIDGYSMNCFVLQAPSLHSLRLNGLFYFSSSSAMQLSFIIKVKK